MKNLKVGKDKYINILVRMKNPVWTAALIVQIANTVIFVIRALGGNVADNAEETVGSLAQGLAWIIATSVGHVIDGTTKGLADSNASLNKNKPESVTLEHFEDNQSLGGGSISNDPELDTSNHDLDPEDVAMDPQFNPSISEQGK